MPAASTADREWLGSDHAGEVSPIGDAVAMSSPDAAPTQRIVRLVGVYDADSTLRGELAYWVGARLGRRHCSLCEITHGSVRQRPEWKACQVGLPVPFDTFHRDDQADTIRGAAGGQAPVVVAETDTGPVLLLDSGDLDACDGSIDRLVDAIEQAAARLGLLWTTHDSAASAARERRPDWRTIMTLDVGDPFPDIELVDHEGRPWRTAEMRGRPLVLILHRHLA